MPDVALIFPPLVTTNFGQYYPSLAVLAAALHAAGRSVDQLDLNEGFVDRLLRSDHLDEVGAGQLLGATVAAGSDAAVAARLLRTRRDALYDQQDRHRFGGSAPDTMRLLTMLAEAYRVDLPVAELVSERFGNSPQARFYEAFADQALAGCPGAALVGITVPMGPQLGPAVVLARVLRRRYPAARIVLGGPAISLMDPSDLAMLLTGVTEIDAAVRFDGEKPLLALTQQALAGSWQPAEVGGVSARTTAGVVHVPPDAGLPLGLLPFGRYDEALLARLHDPEIGIVQARGCYWGKCSYCDFVELYDGSPRYRTRTPALLVEEMQAQTAWHGVRRFAIVTESLPPAFARRMSEEILALGLDVTWNSFAMVDRRFDEQTLRSMAESGCEYLVIGAETMTDRVLALVSKSATGADNEAFFRTAARAGIRLRVNLIPDLPSTSYDEALAALAAFGELRDCFESVAVFPFEATRSSEVGREPARFGLVLAGDQPVLGQAQYAGNHLPNLDPAMSAEQRAEVHARYRAFAAELNAADTLPEHAGYSDLRADATVRLPRERIDLVEDAGSTVCFDSVTGRRHCFPSAWQPILRVLGDGVARPWSEFSRVVADPIARDVLTRAIAGSQLLERVSR
ncbi:MAG: radical SAM protein [Jatrophihabitantaceae bacterium]